MQEVAAPVRASGSGEGGAALHVMLAEKSALLAAAEERLARLEALQTLAQAPFLTCTLGRSSCKYQHAQLLCWHKHSLRLLVGQAFRQVNEGSPSGSPKGFEGLHVHGAQDTALRAEAQLEDMRAALAGLAQTAQLGRADAGNARSANSA